MLVTVTLFGPLRRHGSSVSCEVAADARVAELRDALLPRLGHDPLLASCVLANERSVLSEEGRLVEGESYALLPPVCGG